MAKIHVTAKRDFLQSLAAARPVAAISELIWNGFDAHAEKVAVYLDFNAMGGLQTIRVQDNGTGIDFAAREELFGSLGESWKRNHARINGRGIHGKNGKGRFKAFALGGLVEWNTTFRDKTGKLTTYKITGNIQSLDDFETSQPNRSALSTTGTEVTISNPLRNFRSLYGDAARLEITKIFAVYLTEYPLLVLEYDGRAIDPAEAQVLRSSYDLGQVRLPDGETATVNLSIIEWATSTERAFHFCDGSGISLFETEVGQQVRAPGFNFTVYIKSDHFRDLAAQNLLALDELHPDVAEILKTAVSKVRDHFRRRAAEDQSKIVERWKEEKIYPYDEGVNLTPV